MLVKDFKIYECEDAKDFLFFIKYYLDYGNYLISTNHDKKNWDLYRNPKIVKRTCKTYYIMFKMTLRAIYKLKPQKYDKVLLELFEQNHLETNLIDFFNFNSFKELELFGLAMKQIEDINEPVIKDCINNFQTIYEIIYQKGFMEGIRDKNLLEIGFTLIEDYIIYLAELLKKQEFYKKYRIV